MLTGLVTASRMNLKGCAWPRTRMRIYALIMCLAGAICVPAARADIEYLFFAAPSFPIGELVEGTNGSLYGVAEGGGVYSSGSVFKLTPDGQTIEIFSF